MPPLRRHAHALALCVALAGGVAACVFRDGDVQTTPSPRCQQQVDDCVRACPRDASNPGPDEPGADGDARSACERSCYASCDDA